MPVQTTARRTKVQGRYSEGLYVSASGRYEFRVRDPKQRWIGCVDDGGGSLSLREAQEFRHRYLGLDESERPRANKMTFLELAELTFAANPDWKPGTLRNHEKELRSNLAPLHRLKPSEITPSSFSRLVLRPMTERGLSTGSLSQTIATAGIIFRQGMFETPRVVFSNPITPLRPQDRRGRDTEYAPRVITAEELARIIETIGRRVKLGTGFTKLHFQVAIGLMGLAGFRIGEALGIFWDDVDFEAGTLMVERQKLSTGLYGPPKTKSSRATVELCGTLERLLKTLWIQQGQPADRHTPVLAGKDGESPSGTAVRDQLIDACDHLKLEEGEYPTPHAFRHSYGSALMDRVSNGIGIAKVSRQMRHKDVGVTIKTYTHEWNAGAEVGSAAKILDEVFADVFPVVRLVG